MILINLKYHINKYQKMGGREWWSRMAEAMTIICDKKGRPKTKIHGLKMLDPSIFSYIPLASADSTNVARNIGIDSAWTGPYTPASKKQRAAILAERIESHASASAWSFDCFPQQLELELFG